MDKMDPYNTYRSLDQEFAQSLGYSGKREIPDALVLKVAEFIDAHPADMMTAYYAKSLLDKFYRKRKKRRSGNLFNALDSYLRNKRFLIPLFLEYRNNEKNPFSAENHDIAAIWLAIHDLPDGYDKANCIGKFHVYSPAKWPVCRINPFLRCPTYTRPELLGEFIPEWTSFTRQRFFPTYVNNFALDRQRPRISLRGCFRTWTRNPEPR
ncbi:hypothetical protein PO883_30670 [Massilia sp. DJPM01]|uniref:hypothetical protein n=1 Tax=Massilia sp. DJPM01 TaxID=3024404 RepID=UPI00259F9C04|nr:hypothetical protein [Massilia sp. DJPM01]MDM5181545.1 hypothetical protein [Massilia sp. DJPM01]